ncbi:MAG: signal peptidase I [Pyrinomonadaceae bacterium]
MKLLILSKLKQFKPVFAKIDASALDRERKLFYDFEMSKPANRIEVSTPIVKTTDGKKNSSLEAAKPETPTIKKSVFREYFESFVVTLIMAFFGMTFIVQAVTVPTGSMQNTINTDDNLLVNKFIFAPGPTLPFLPMREIRRGDIIVFKYPGNPHNPEQNKLTGYTPYQTNYVKRVIGLPGDMVEFRDNTVYINGDALPEHRITAEAPLGARNPGKVTLKIINDPPRKEGETYDVYYNSDTMEEAEHGLLPLARGQYHAKRGQPERVPDNSYYVMGDSRDNSEDSRFWGFVPRDLVVGRPMFIYWSCDQSKEISFVECLTHPRFDRIGKLIK